MRRGADGQVPELRGALVAAAARRAGADTTAGTVPARAATLRARRTIRHARRVPLLMAVLAVVLLSAAVALAASGLIQTGAPVKPLPGLHFTPTTGYGVPIVASVRLLPISVPDPAGGPPWGLRYLRTTRGFGCVEVGRVVGGRLGVLGRDGSFGNDGRFHELPADVFEPLSCVPLDEGGHAFIALTFHGRLASGTDRFGCLPPGSPSERGIQACPRADERLVSYGLLGPDARSFTYHVSGGSRTLTIKAPLGAYLVVQPLVAPRGQTLGWVAPLTSPGTGPLTEVRYANGAVCHIPPANRTGGAHPCPRVGFLARRSPPLVAAQVTAAVSARLGPVTHIAFPASKHGPTRARQLHLTFRARVTVANADSRYLVELHSPGVAVPTDPDSDLTSVEPGSQGRLRGPCGHDSHSIRLSPVEQDVHAGELVHVGLVLAPACPGRWSGRVLYTAASLGQGLPFAEALLPRRGRRGPLLVGGFSFVIR